MKSTAWQLQIVVAIVSPIYAPGRGCVKTLFKWKFAANLPDFRKLQFAKALISLQLKFWRLGFNHNFIRSLTFSHSLGQLRTDRALPFIRQRLSAAASGSATIRLLSPSKMSGSACGKEVDCRWHTYALSGFKFRECFRDSGFNGGSISFGS